MVSLKVRFAPILLALGLGLSAGCNGCNQKGVGDKPTPAPPSSAEAPAFPAGRVMTDLIEELPACDIEHRGILFDAGTPAMTGRYAWTGTAPPGVENVEHDASTWIRVSSRTLKVFFMVPEPSHVFVATRALGHASKSASVLLDDQPLGTLNFIRDQVRVATTPVTNLPVDAGMHTLTFRFSGKVRDDDAFVDIDWIRIGIPDESTVTFGAPTLRDIVTTRAALSGVPHRALAMRGPGALRCTLRWPPGARLRTSIGLMGAGEADATIRILRDGEKPTELLVQHVTGGDKAVWTDVDLPLDEYAGKLSTIELGMEATPPGSRVMFGDPSIVLLAPPPPATAKARAVVVVVMGSVERAALPPWHGAPTPQLPALSDLALTATTFHRHRAPTTFPGSVVASLLTALPPRGHTVTDLGARMPSWQTTLGGIAHDASIRAAMFTGVPSTFKSFGFGSGWEHFVEYPPYGNDPATAPLDGAAAWMTDVLRQAPDARLLVVVHSRGGHPPWDITPKELALLPPSKYTGVIEPRRGAQQLASARKRKNKRDVLSTQDQERVRALEAAALADEDRALGNLVTALKTAGIWENTVFVVTGDVSTGAASLYDEGTDLAEPFLTLPLYVRFPEGRHGGTHVNLPTEIWDITQTAISALGISFSRQGLGRDLSGVASGLEDSTAEPQIATLDERYSARWGELIMTGRYDGVPSLCDLSLDPMCAFNRRDTMPVAAQALFRRIMARDQSTRVDVRKREPASFDNDTVAALRVWGTID
ncbi:MAG: sulfatase-like hydrolase/transferase [Polyangiaceae bacterium]|nr:sulfatase-like hydrolase/transferase [Polyangiaceae bacterium]